MCCDENHCARMSDHDLSLCLLSIVKSMKLLKRCEICHVMSGVMRCSRVAKPDSIVDVVNWCRSWLAIAKAKEIVKLRKRRFCCWCAFFICLLLDGHVDCASCTPFVASCCLLQNLISGCSWRRRFFPLKNYLAKFAKFPNVYAVSLLVTDADCEVCCNIFVY